MYNEYRYPAFLRGLIVSELPIIIDHAILRTISRQQATYPSRASDDLLELHVSFALDEVGNVLVAEAKEDVQKGLSHEFLQTTINQVYAEFHYEFVREIANFNHNLEI